MHCGNPLDNLHATFEQFLCLIGKVTLHSPDPSTWSSENVSLELWSRNWVHKLVDMDSQCWLPCSHRSTTVGSVLRNPLAYSVVEDKHSVSTSMFF